MVRASVHDAPFAIQLRDISIMLLISDTAYSLTLAFVAWFKHILYLIAHTCSTLLLETFQLKCVQLFCAVLIENFLFE